MQCRVAELLNPADDHHVAVQPLTVTRDVLFDELGNGKNVGGEHQHDLGRACSNSTVVGVAGPLVVVAKDL
jgi:hypothetical protein